MKSLSAVIANEHSSMKSGCTDVLQMRTCSRLLCTDPYTEEEPIRFKEKRSLKKSRYHQLQLWFCPEKFLKLIACHGSGSASAHYILARCSFLLCYRKHPEVWGFFETEILFRVKFIANYIQVGNADEGHYPRFRTMPSPASRDVGHVYYWFLFSYNFWFCRLFPWSLFCPFLVLWNKQSWAPIHFPFNYSNAKVLIAKVMFSGWKENTWPLWPLLPWP